MSRHKLIGRGCRLTVAVAFGAVFIAACGQATGGSTRTTATLAELPGGTPNYIFPMAAAQYFTTSNSDWFTNLMWRPMYWYGDNGTVRLNDSLSLANEPKYSSDGLTVTITLKNYRWSDGTKLTTRDVTFWINLLRADKASWGGYVPGGWPDNIASFRADSDTTLTLHMTHPYGSYFFTYNELSQIIPLPQHVWDKESATSPVGDYDETTSGAVAVFNFLDSESKQLATYSTNPLWQVVDGPWKLKSLDSRGDLRMVPNTMYSGPVKPKLSEFDEVPFTQDTAEFNVLRGGPSSPNAIDYGYMPYQDVPQRSTLTALGYSFEPWEIFSIDYVTVNFANSMTGPVFSQLYFRQAMQHLVDQSTFIQRAFAGFAYPTYGPVPPKPATTFLDSFQQHNPYPFNPQAAISALRDHGWSVNPDGVTTCTEAGSASNQCGAGIAAGTQASFQLEYSSGFPAIDTMVEQLKTDFALAGISLTIKSAPFNTVLGDTVGCTSSSCTWDLAMPGPGSQWVFSPDYYPTGDELFATGATSNGGSYSDPTTDALVAATESSNSLTALHDYEDHLVM
ncbi:MAG: ABC transporter substrate-binding protein, partial [Gammaproteobacteria bacterium]|nr:ABC transporter substrate-binding protein [Gammaproteobacteria bacterium]